MQPQSEDAHFDVEKIDLDFYRRASPSQKLAAVDALNQAMRLDILKEHPDTSEEEVKLMIAERMYGKELIDKVRAELERRKQK
ncbi:MAG: hypothetical protein H0U76_07595 [Ktedonobacteraceae bacterium]|nr:hypothetical protein [Ktedonobacteraceae bacterium]